MQRISQKVYETDKGLWNTIKKWFEDLVAKLKKLFADLDPQSENGRIVRDMGDRLDSVRQMWADMVVEAGVVEKSEIDSMVKSSKKDFEDYDKPITLADVEILRSIGRKSINAFSAEEIKKAQNWAYKFYQELGTKSPFFRAWFGEWRAHQLDSFVDVVETKNRVGKNPRGTFVNNDTGWKISSTSVGYDETTSHSGKNKKSIIAMQNIDAIIENAILFDTEVSEYGKGKKSFYTAFMHKFYAPIDIDGKLYIAKMAVEESYVPKQDETHKKFYHVRSIQIETVSSVGIGKSHTPIMDNTVSKYSIADLYELVKTFDKEFTPAPEVSKYMLNEDGTPKLLYHQTAEDFSQFDPRHKGAGTNDDETPFGVFMKPNETDIGLKGKKQMALYARIGNPLIVANRAEMVSKLKSISRKYGELIEQRNALSSEYKAKIEDAAQKWSQYAKDYRVEHPNANRTDLSHDAEFNKLFDAEDELTEEWIAKADKISLLMKEEITKTLKDNRYDGVIIQKDEGSRGRTVETFIALNPEQVKSATDNIGTFSKYEKDIRYSRKISDPYTSRELLAKALTKVAKGEDRAIVESYKANVNLIKGETARLESLRKEIDEIKYKKSITYEGRELSVKEFEQIAYTRAEETGIEAERVKFKEQSLYKKDHDKKS